MKEVLIYKGFERFWHWSQAFLIIFLGFTGFEVHGLFHFFGFEKAVHYHRTSAYAFFGLIVFAVFWHLTSGEWRHYVPTFNNLRAQARYYLKGIFQAASHPTKKTVLRKLNPIQILVYLGFKLLLIPMTVLSGIAFLFHKTLDRNDVVVIRDISLESIAAWHMLGAFGLLAFGIVHVYMTTTGQTPLSNLRSMITGYEIVEEEDGDKRRQRNVRGLRASVKHVPRQSGRRK